jgi:3-dehydroquinate synthase
MNNIYLIGFMGSGKTTTGKLISKTLGRKFIDMDELISSMFGMSVNRIFETHGEDGFRKAEARILMNLSKAGNLVISTGGGIYENTTNRERIKKSGISIYLDASLNEIRKRLKEDEIAQRPLWRRPSSVEKLFLSRREHYLDSDHKIAVDGLSPNKVASIVCSFVYPERDYFVNYEGYQSRVKVVWDGPGTVGELVRGRKTAILTDQNVQRLHLDRYLEILDDPTVISLKPGEKTKTFRMANFIYEKLLQARIGRGDVLLAIGGGVITDIGGFVASTYKRGIDFVLVGTTMVACVDAAIGGKSAIDVGNIKNSVGLFSKPLASVLDLQSMNTLRSNQVSEGLIEAYKTGLVADPQLCAYMNRNVSLFKKKSIIELAEVLTTSALAKCSIVSKDFRERDLRRILNLGHTYGHAVESYNNYSISHGLAVAKGITVSTHLSCHRGLIRADDAATIIETLDRIYSNEAKLPTAEQAWEIMLNDKKNKDGKITFVLLNGIGKCIMSDDVTKHELDLAIEKLRATRND